MSQIRDEWPLGTSESTAEEVYLADAGPEGLQIRQITNYGATIDEWELGTIETIEWTSRDGTTIQGVLRKPSAPDPARRYPLAYHRPRRPGMVLAGSPSPLRRPVISCHRIRQ